MHLTRMVLHLVRGERIDHREAPPIGERLGEILGRRAVLLHPEKDLERLLEGSEGESIVVTEKDAVKLIELPGTPDAPIWVLGQVFVWGEDPGPLVDVVVRRIRDPR